ncbi:MAG: tetratricopeptide repeat protein, partial [Bacteroidota bacterium]
MNTTITCGFFLLCWGMMFPYGIAQSKDETVELRISFLDSLGRSLAYHDLDSAFTVTQTALALSLQHDLPSNRAHLLSQLGLLYKKEGDYAQSHVFQDSSRRLYRQLGDSVGMALPIRREADLFRIEGQYPEAQAYFLHALRLLENSQDSLGISGAWVNLGILYTVQQQFDIAQQYYQKALGYIYRNPDTLQLINLYTNIGTTNYYQGNLDSASFYFNKALEFKSNGQFVHKMLPIYGNLAGLKLQMEKFDEAKIEFERGLKLIKRLNLDSSLVGLRYMSNYALVLAQIGEKGKAIAILNSTKTAAELKNLNEILANSLFNLTKLYELEGRPQKALNLLQEYVTVREKVLNEETIEQVSKF